MSLENIRLIAFDLDGTLLNSVPDLAVATSAAVESLGYPPVTEQQVSLWVGNGVEVLLSRAISGDLTISATLDKAELSRGRSVFNRVYKAGGHQLGYLYPTVKSTLQALHQQGYILALVTNKPSEFVPDILAQYGIDSLFSDAIGGEDFPKRKPDPMSLNWLLEKHGLRPEQMLMVGDSKTDIQTAKNTGCHSFALTYGYNHGEPITLAEPDYVADQLAELLPLLTDA